MTEYERIRDAAIAAQAAIIHAAPEKTGNLKRSIKIRFEPYRIIIYVDVGNGDTRAERADGEAPYMKYTEESWDKFKPPLRGKENPHEGWFKAAVNTAANRMAELLGGVIR